MPKVTVVVPNWNGRKDLPSCLDSLLSQTLKPRIVVVENGSVDGSLEVLYNKYPSVEVIVHKKNKGFAGGVNAGIRKAVSDGDDFVALFNNDAVADNRWLELLVKGLDSNPKAGIATCKFMDSKGKRLDSTGDMYTIWGLAYPRGRGEPVSDKYDKSTDIFAASGGASLYRITMLNEIGLFDEDFFAYYEDVDLSFRAQLYGWKVVYVPDAVAYHKLGATSSKIKGFTTYHALKNQPWLLIKNVPAPLLSKIVPRFCLAYFGGFLLGAIGRRQFTPAIKGTLVSLILLPKKLVQRRHIQANRKVSPDYIGSIIVGDLPPNAYRLQNLRDRWRKLSGGTTGL